jgi:predicted nucleic acid-binding protein
VNSDRYVLDTSALLALIEDEPGADRVAQVLAEELVLLPWTVLLEVHYVTRQRRGQAEADQRYAMVRQLPARILWEMNEPMVLTAARLKAAHWLSFADAVIAAFALREGATLLHKDPQFEALDEEVTLEALPYKVN